MNTDSFALRHIGPRENDLPEMLKTIGVSSIDQLIYETVPDDILLKKALDLDTAMSEQEYLEHITELSTKNKLFKRKNLATKRFSLFFIIDFRKDLKIIYIRKNDFAFNHR